jgi:hypothetical protein
MYAESDDSVDEHATLVHNERTGAIVSAAAMRVAVIVIVMMIVTVIVTVMMMIVKIVMLMVLMMLMTALTANHEVTYTLCSTSTIISNMVYHDYSLVVTYMILVPRLTQASMCMYMCMY